MEKSDHPFDNGYDLYDVHLDGEIFVLAKSAAKAEEIAKYDADISDEVIFSAQKTAFVNRKGRPVKYLLIEDSLPWGDNNTEELTVADLAQWVEDKRVKLEKKKEFERRQGKLF